MTIPPFGNHILLTVCLLSSFTAAAVELPFGPRITLTESLDAAQVVFAADLDGDGDADVLSIAELDDQLVWYENDGLTPPGFLERVISDSVDGGRTVHAIDIDRDGDLDVLATSELDTTIAWYENDGRSPPAFTQRVIDGAAPGPSSILGVDVDGDGDQDVVASLFHINAAVWYENDGAVPPGFSMHIVTTDAQDIRLAAAADVDSDGDTDLLTASERDDTVAWYENDGGSPPAFSEHIVTTTANAAASVFAADVDGDGDQDLLSASGYDATIAWYENDGDTPPGFVTHVISSSTHGAQSVYALDVDGDGDTDVLAAAYFESSIIWFENDGEPEPGFSEHLITDLARGTRSVFALDVDGDGDIDVLSASERDDTVAWYPNRSLHRSAAFGEGRIVSDALSGAVAVLDADLDRDGDQDLVAAAAGEGRIAWFENDGQTEPAFIERTVTADAPDARAIHAADVDGDGDSDLIAASAGDHRVAWYVNDGAVPPGFTLRSLTTDALGARAVHAGDLDADGDSDILAGSELDDTIAWFENDGAPEPGFIEHEISASVSGASAVHAVDLDGDGDLDVLSAGAQAPLRWHVNDGAVLPMFFPVTVASGIAAAVIIAADPDADGDQDVVGSFPLENLVTWHADSEATTPLFAEHIITDSAGHPRGVTAGDIDRDGDLDVLVASAGDDSIAWHENDGGAPPAFLRRVIDDGALGAESARMIDVDGDGDLDVAATAAESGTLAWYPNCGGQFALINTDTAPAELAEGAITDVLAIDLVHRGRAGDEDLEWALLGLRFQDAADLPLTTAQANALIDALAVYRDEGSGVFEQPQDRLVAVIPELALRQGYRLHVFTDGDPELRVGAGTPQRYFLVLRLTSDAADQTPDAFRITHVLEGGGRSRSHDRAFDLPLSLECGADFSTRLITAVEGPAQEHSLSAPP